MSCKFVKKSKADLKPPLTPAFSSPERGSAIIMAYLAILMFLYMAILFLDIPYLERVGRSIQRAADAAALAGAAQLTARADPAPGPEDGWRHAKRAVFATLRANSIAGSEALVFDKAGCDLSGPQDTLDTSDYGYENFNLSGGSLTGRLTITRGVYDRPLAWNPPDASGLSTEKQKIFFPVEIGDLNRSGFNCITTPSDLKETKDPTGAFWPPDVPKACLTPEPVYKVADSVSVTITINKIPTLFAKVLGFDSFTSITRTSISAPK